MEEETPEPVAVSAPQDAQPVPAPAPQGSSIEKKPAEKKKPRTAGGSGGGSNEKKEDGEGIKDIWAQLLEQQPEINNKEECAREASIVFIGPRHSGKSTMIHAYMFKDKEDTPKPTTSLDYKYTRSSVGMSIEKDLSHFWELGGGRALVNLMEICITPNTLENTLVVLNLDLSRQSAIIDDCQYWLEMLRARVRDCNTALHEKKSNIPKKLEAAQREQLGDQHEDLNRVDIIGIPVLIVANKYDYIKDENAEKLKVIAKSLRVLAHSQGCGLLYASKSHKPLLQTFRSRISRHVLNRPPSKTVQTDYTKPLSVPAGCDTFEDIGMPPESSGSQAPVMAWTEYFKKIFPLKNEDKEETILLDDVTLASEPVIDQMRAQKDEDLKQLKRKLQLKRRMKQVDVSEQQKKTKLGSFLECCMS